MSSLEHELPYNDEVGTYEVRCPMKNRCGYGALSETPLFVRYHRRLDLDPREEIRRDGAYGNGFWVAIVAELVEESMGEKDAGGKETVGEEVNVCLREPKNVVDYPEDDYYWWSRWPIEVIELGCRYDPDCLYLQKLRSSVSELQKDIQDSGRRNTSVSQMLTLGLLERRLSEIKD